MSIFQAWFTTESIRFRTRALKALLRDQRAEFSVIRRHLRPGDIACDIGANKGSFIYWLSWWVRNGRVVAFEPQLAPPRACLRLASARQPCSTCERRLVGEEGLEPSKS